MCRITLFLALLNAFIAGALLPFAVVLRDGLAIVVIGMCLVSVVWLVSDLTREA